MYHYYQRGTDPKERWHPIPEARVKGLAERFVPMVTVLSVSDISNKAESVKFKGPLYFDIDNADINVSITSTQKLINQLTDIGVPEPEIYLSGKKGFHVIIAASVFSDGKAIENLPYIYGAMAENFDIEGLDPNVYSGGKGRMLRQANVQRADTGTYKVPVTLEELYELTAESYKAFVSQPRTHIKYKKKTGVSPDLMQMFMAAKAEVKARLEECAEILVEPDERLEHIDLANELPKCLDNLVNGVGVRVTNLNRATMNFAGLMKVFGASSEVIEKLALRMSVHNNYESVSYNTEHKRLDHIKKMLGRANHDSNIGFMASYLFSSIEKCGGCVLCDGSLTDKEESESEEIEGNPIMELNGRYYVRGHKKNRQLSTFLITPESYSVTHDEDDDVSLRNSVIGQVRYQVNGHPQLLRKEFEEGVWNSNASFKRSLEGIGNAIWLGSDIDLMLLKHYLFTGKTDMNEIVKTSKIGLRVEENPSGKILVYVEQNHSINSFHERDTHKLTRNITAPSKLLTQTNLCPTDEAELKTILSTLKINERHKAALMVGWMMASHIKPHFQEIANQFPILSIWGNAGSGKTKSASVLSYFHGCDYEGADSVATLGGSTPWATAEFVASSTSTPRLLDEFNRSKLEKSGKYSKIADLIKSAWGNQPHMRGTVSGTKSGSAEVSTLHMSGAVVIMSEQQPDEPPILQRIVQVQLSQKGRENFTHHWDDVYTNRKSLARFGKHCMEGALRTTLTWVKERMAYWREYLPAERDLDSRPHFSFSAVLVGLDYMAKTAIEQIGLEPDHDLLKTIANSQQSIIDHLTGNLEEIKQEKSSSVSDRVLVMIAMVAAESADGGVYGTRLDSGTHFLKADGFLYLDMPVAFSAALRYANALRQPLEVTTLKMLKTLMSDETYLVSTSEVVSFSPRAVWKLDIDMMEKKGLDCTLFPDAV